MDISKIQIFKILKTSIALFVLFVFSACNILPGDNSSGGLCQTTDGSVVDTYNIFGTWKKISGYSSPRSETRLQNDYDVLIVMRTGGTCRVEFENAAQTTITKEFYNFTHDVDLKSLELSSIDGEEGGSIKYRFSGSCGDTKMTWTWSNGGVEIFQYRSKNLDEVSCSE